MIKLFVGKKGSGKTLQMIKDAQYFFNNGYKVYSNVACWGYKNNGFLRKKTRVKAEFIYFDELQKIIKNTLENKNPTLFMLDEVPVMFHSRNWKTFDLDLIYALNQSRKTDVHLFMSAQIFTAVDKQLRLTADYIYMCEKRLFKPIELFTVMVVDPTYFNDEVKNIFLKNYIKKRKYFFNNNLKKYHHYYDTGQVVLPKRFQEKFPNLFPDPKKLGIPEIIMSSMEHKDRNIPL